jgi:hypothetical protein
MPDAENDPRKWFISWEHEKSNLLPPVEHDHPRRTQVGNYHAASNSHTTGNEVAEVLRTAVAGGPCPFIITGFTVFVFRGEA